MKKPLLIIIVIAIVAVGSYFAYDQFKGEVVEDIPSVTVECQLHSDCVTPEKYTLLSHCQYGSMCIENKCEVVCPGPDYYQANTGIPTCDDDIDCEDKDFFGMETSCIDSMCVAVIDQETGSTNTNRMDEENAPINTSAEVESDTNNIIVLHHSTGGNIWDGGVGEWIDEYNDDNGTNYRIVDQEFPKDSPYGWENYPYDYWNIWVNNAGSTTYKDEPTLEILTSQYDTISWKHCFPVSDIEADTGSPSVSSSDKTIENYKLQYAALKNKMLEFPDTNFIVWTGAAQVRGATTPEYARRAQEFFTWVVDTWDESGDNIYVWDFYSLETGGGLYVKNEYAESTDDSHPNSSFSRTAAPLFAERIVDVIEGRGDGEQSLLGESVTNEFIAPIDRADERITKKPFGIYITPDTSPVQPEKFSGYHTGTDYEIFENEEYADVTIQALCDGEIVVKQKVNGYGGVLIQQCVFKNENVTVLYGHLNLASITKEVGDTFTQEEVVGVLGQGFSSQTDGERKHLHVAVHKGIGIEFSGYVNSEDELQEWFDPEELYQKRTLL
ncbi:M23 family metallopeptidase [Patescibacteria group bacterium]